MRNAFVRPLIATEVTDPSKEEQRTVDSLGTPSLTPWRRRETPQSTALTPPPPCQASPNKHWAPAPNPTPHPQQSAQQTAPPGRRAQRRTRSAPQEGKAQKAQRRRPATAQGEHPWGLGRGARTQTCAGPAPLPGCHRGAAELPEKPAAQQPGSPLLISTAQGCPAEAVKLHRQS